MQATAERPSGHGGRQGATTGACGLHPTGRMGGCSWRATVEGAWAAGTGFPGSRFELQALLYGAAGECGEVGGYPRLLPSAEAGTHPPTTRRAPILQQTLTCGGRRLLSVVRQTRRHGADFESTHGQVAGRQRRRRARVFSGGREVRRRFLIACFDELGRRPRK